MITLQQIQEKLAFELKNSNFTQKELAIKLGIKQQQISCYIHGKKMPAIDTLANICNFLDLDANDILCLNRTENSRIKYNQTYVGNINVHNK